MLLGSAKRSPHDDGLFLRHHGTATLNGDGQCLNGDGQCWLSVRRLCQGTSAAAMLGFSDFSYSLNSLKGEYVGVL